MHIILIPGLWLDGSSWDRVVNVLASAGHQPHPLTLPGMETVGADRSGIGLQDHIRAVVEVIDACDPNDGQVLVVGHSAGGGVAHAAVDARPDRVARVVYVGGFPTPDGRSVAGDFPTEAGGIPLPDWSMFDDVDLEGMDEEARAAFRRRVVPSPARLATERQTLSDDRRYRVPATVICTEFSSEMLLEWIEQDLEPVGEFRKIRHLEFVDLPTGHWPQFTRPEDLGRIIAERAYKPMIDEHERIHPPAAAGETLTMLGFLDYQRETLAWKAGGLQSDGLNARVAASSLTLGGLLKHMAWVEDYWFARRLHGRPPSPSWDAVDWSAEPDWEFTSSREDSPDDLRTVWGSAVRRSRALTAAAIADGGLDRPEAWRREDEPVSLRWILVHMIEEYARHNGHADLLRESIDGQTGE